MINIKQIFKRRTSWDEVPIKRVILVTISAILKELADRLPFQYKEFVKIFGKEPQTALPDHGPHDMTIDLEPGKEPSSGKLYPFS